MYKIIISLFFSGLFFGAGPCLVSCGPVMISYIAGTKKGIGRSLEAYFLFSLGRILVYVILALAVFFLGEFVFASLSRQFSGYIIVSGAGFMILLGLAVALGRRKEPAFCKFLGRNILSQGKFSALFLGLVFGLLPCAPLMAVFSYAGLVSKSWLESLIYALAFGLGTFISPLILLAVLAGAIPKLMLEKKTLYQEVFNAVCGAVIIMLGIGLMRKAF